MLGRGRRTISARTLGKFADDGLAAMRRTGGDSLNVAANAATTTARSNRSTRAPFLSFNSMIIVSTHIEEPSFGDRYSSPPGVIAQIGSSNYRHRFGGCSWTVVDPRPEDGGPTLLFVLDLQDPLLDALEPKGLTELPLCSYATRDVWADAQLYLIIPTQKRVTLLQKSDPVTEACLHEFAGVLPEKNLALAPMSDIDYPTSEDSYWQACDCFLGGTRFIRILGPPLWMDVPATVKCECQRSMDYVAALGYENIRERSAFVEGGLFLGEGAIYWFFCAHCLAVAVISQST